MHRGFPEIVRAVTFDCWSTLIHEVPAASSAAAKLTGPERRGVRLSALLGLDPALAMAAFNRAWQAHQRAWHRREAFTGRHMLDHALAELAVTLDDARRESLLRELEDETLQIEIRAVAGAAELLAEWRGRGLRTALICDTGFTPGRVVRELLARHGLSKSLEVMVFSDELGVCKPHPQAFHSALSELGVPARAAVHVGDLRRSDVAGARAAGMGSVRFRGQHDDHEQASGRLAGIIDCVSAGCTPLCARPEAHYVVDSYEELSALLDSRLSANEATGLERSGAAEATPQ